METLKIRSECYSCSNFRGKSPESAICLARQNPTCYRKKKRCGLHKEKKAVPKDIKKTAIAYVDGCYNKGTRMFGYGVVFLMDGKEKNFYGEKPDKSGGWQIEGELTAALVACEKAIECGCASIEIRYDYEGVANWPTGYWRTNKSYTRKYAVEMRKIMKKISVSFTHIKAHKGEAGNEKADKLAKYACGISRYFPEEPIGEELTGKQFVGTSVKKEKNKLKEDAKNKASEDIFPECRDAIINFYNKENHSFRDYVGLKTFGMDCYSYLGEEELDSYMKENGLESIKEHFAGDVKAVNSALRWCMRGLLCEDAIRKVEVDQEVSLNATKAKNTPKKKNRKGGFR